MSLQKDILDYLESLDHCWPVKVISSNKRGCPDILCCYYGIFVAIEVKSKNDTTTAIQDAQIELIKQVRGVWFVANCLPEVEFVFSRLQALSEVRTRPERRKNEENNIYS